MGKKEVGKTWRVRAKGDRNKVKISTVPGKNIFRKHVGGHVFYLGTDKALAKTLAATIVMFWRMRKLQTGRWIDPDDFDMISEMKEALYSGTDRVVVRCGEDRITVVNDYTGRSAKGDRERAASGQPPVAGGAMTVGEAIAAFRDRVEADSQRADSTRSTMLHKLDALEDHLPLEKPLGEIGFDELTDVVNRLVARPKSNTTGKPIASQTAINWIGATRQLFTWCRDSGKWTEPRGYERIFRVNRRAMLTNAERKRAAQGVETFTLEELGKLWAAANEQNRLFVLLGLNCGFAQMEMATLRTWEIDLKANPPRIERNRRKTDVYGQWVLWPKTVELLRRRLKRTLDNDEELALLTRNGKPLVEYTGRSRKDAICQSWAKLRKKAGVNALGFKHLRKTGADIIRKIASVEVSESYLAHSEKTLARVYSNPDFDKLADALAEMETKLAPSLWGA